MSLRRIAELRNGKQLTLLRNSRGIIKMIPIELPDGYSREMNFQVMKAQAYSIDEIFKKDLLFLLPFYAMRYEYLRKPRYKSQSEGRKQLLSDLVEILDRLYQVCIDKNSLDLYEDLCGMQKLITDYIYRDSDIRKDVDKMSRGRILRLPSDKYKKKEAKAEARGIIIGKAEGKAEGFVEGKAEMTSDIQTIAPLLKEYKDDSSI